MYATKAVNGVPAIQRDGQSVLSVSDRDWDFANWLCALLNELGQKSDSLLNERTGKGSMRTVTPSEGRYSMPDEAEFHPLHTNWVLIGDTKGNSRPQTRWVVDR